MGGTYQFTKNATANLREKDDYVNSALGGFLAGAIMGTRCEFCLIADAWAIVNLTNPM